MLSLRTKCGNPQTLLFMRLLCRSFLSPRNDNIVTINHCRSNIKPAMFSRMKINRIITGLELIPINRDDEGGGLT